MTTIHDLARKFISEKSTVKWTDAKKSAVFSFADWIVDNAPKRPSPPPPTSSGVTPGSLGEAKVRRERVK